MTCPAISANMQLWAVSHLAPYQPDYDSVFYAIFCVYTNHKKEPIKIRRGSKIAAMAVAHSMLTAIYYILKNNQPFHDLGADYYNKFNREKKINSYLKKLNELGYDMTAVPAIP